MSCISCLLQNLARTGVMLRRNRTWHEAEMKAGVEFGPFMHKQGRMQVGGVLCFVSRFHLFEGQVCA